LDGACHFENRRPEPKHLVIFRVSVPALAQVIHAPIMAGYFETVPRRRNPCCGSPGYQSNHGQSLDPQHLISRAKRPQPHLRYLLLHRTAGGDLAISSNLKKPRPSIGLGPGLTASGMRCMSDGSDTDILTAAA
jgi:hypothetical protein